MKRPHPGRPVRGSRTGKPIMALLDLLGRRGALRITWELRGGARSFRELLVAAETSPGVLRNRLSELCAARIVTASDFGYTLTREGTRWCANTSCRFLRGRKDGRGGSIRRSKPNLPRP